MKAPIDLNRRYTVEEYFRLDETSEEKLEYHDGYVVPVGGMVAIPANPGDHALVTANVIRALGSILKGMPCRIYDRSLRVNVAGSPSYFNPDVTVIRGQARFGESGQTALNPVMIVEVLSPATVTFDRGSKFDRYREIESLQQYVLIAQTSARVEIFTRKDGVWLYEPFVGIESVAKLASVGVALPLTEIYAGVEFPPPPVPSDEHLKTI